MTVNEKYLRLIDHYCGGNKSRFATSIGVSATVIDNIVGTRGSKPSFDVLRKTLSSYEDINARWLIADTGNMLDATLEVPLPSDKIALEMIRDLSAENALLKHKLEDETGKKNVSMSQCYGNRVAEP